MRIALVLPTRLLTGLLAGLLAGGLPACTGEGPKDTDTPDDTAPDETGDTAPPTFPGTPLSEAYAAIVGDAGSATGTTLAMGPGALVVAAPFGGKVCTFGLPLAAGQQSLDVGGCLEQEASPDYAGWSLAVGDTDGDGVTDVLVGAVGHDTPSADAGKAYLAPATTDDGALADAPASWVGEASLDYAGSAVALADVDGDGADDVVVGAQSNGAGGVGGGRVYLFRSPAIGGSVAAADATITGLGPETVPARLPFPGGAPPPHGAPAYGDGIGSVLANAGDFDGDGLSDLLVGANGADDGGADAGAAGLFFGPLTDGDRAFRDADRLWIGQTDLLYAGDSVAAAGDTDGDGYGDVIVGGDTQGAGVVWLLRGPGGAGTTDITTAPTRFEGAVVGDLAGAYTAPAGDVDGDGAPDLVIGAYGVDLADYNEGAAYLVRGPFFAGVVSLADVPERWVGTVDGAVAGSAVAGGGDIDGDGLPDLVVGARYDTTGGAFAGATYGVVP